MQIYLLVDLLGTLIFLVRALLSFWELATLDEGDPVQLGAVGAGGIAYVGECCRLNADQFRTFCFFTKWCKNIVYYFLSAMALYFWLVVNSFHWQLMAEAERKESEESPRDDVNINLSFRCLTPEPISRKIRM